MVDDINPWFSAHGAKEYRVDNGRHVCLVKWRVVCHLLASDVLFDGIVDHSRVEELVSMRVFDMFCHRVCKVVRRSHKP
jgi:hypothetical protein